MTHEVLCLNRSVFTSSLFQVQFAREPYLSCYQICYLPCHFHLTAPDGTDLISVKPTAAFSTCTCLLCYHIITSILLLHPASFPASPWPTLYISNAQLPGHFLYQAFLNLDSYCAVDYIFSWSNISTEHLWHILAFIYW